MPKELPPPNWEEIKTRYVVNGEKPGDIARDYQITSRAIQKRQCEEGWRQERAEIGQEIREEAIERRKSIATLYLAQIEFVGIEIAQAMREKTIGKTVQDGEGFPNQFYKDAYKAGLDIAKGSDQSVNLTLENFPDVTLKGLE